MHSAWGFLWCFQGAAITTSTGLLLKHSVSTWLPWRFREDFDGASIKTSSGLQWEIHANTVFPWGLPWSFYGTSMGLPWCFHGTPMRASMGLPRKHSTSTEIFMGTCMVLLLQWEFHGASTLIGFPARFHGISTSIGFPWKLSP